MIREIFSDNKNQLSFSRISSAIILVAMISTLVIPAEVESKVLIIRELALSLGIFMAATTGSKLGKS